MKYYQRQGQFEKAVNDKGFKIVKAIMSYGEALFAFDGHDLMGHHSEAHQGAVAENKWESRCMESEIVHVRPI
jgi:hypothetical protein